MTVVVHGEPNGLVVMLAGLIQANLERDPSRRRLLRGGIVELVATDADVAAVIGLSDGRARLANGTSATPVGVLVRASSADLLGLANMPLRFGLPDPRSAAGRELVAAVARRRIRIRGLVRHPILVSRFARLLSAR